MRLRATDLAHRFRVGARRSRRPGRTIAATVLLCVVSAAWSSAASAADTLWGVDSTDRVTDAMVGSIETSLGHPDFYGRYLGTLQRAEVDTAFAHGVAILLIDNSPPSLVGYPAGQAAANTAASRASALGAPHGVGIYEDVEQGDVIDGGFVSGWIDQLNTSGYIPAFYGNPLNGAFSPAYCSAVAANGGYAQTPLWSSVLEPGRTPRASAPAFAPATPPCGADTDLWQYGEPSTDRPGSYCTQTQCAHVDTDIALSSTPLWRAAPPKPACTDASVTVAQAAPTVVRLNCTGDSITYTAPSAPAHGTISAFDAAAGTLTYTPATGYSGPDSFTFAASNAGGGADPATLTITVLPAKPICAAISTLVATSTPTAIQLTCAGQTITYVAPSTPAHGTVAGLDAATGALTYTPAEGYTGPDSFTFTASNAGGISDPATVTVTVSTPPAISNLKAAHSACVRSVRLRGAPKPGTSGLAFSYTLDQPATVLYVLYRRNDSTGRKHCPVHATGHTQDTFTQQGTLTGPAAAGGNSIVVASSAIMRRAVKQRPQLRQALRDGRHSIRVAQITKGHLLAPGTYVLLISAANTLGQRSNVAHAKFFALT